MLNKFKDIFFKYKEIILYLIFGGLTTVVNFIVYIIFNDFIKLSFISNYQYLVATVIAWIVAVIFAYITNKIYVFENKNKNNLIKEFTMFCSCRILSLLFELLIMFIFVDLLVVDDIIAKIIAAIVVIILNYIFSKLFIFKKEGETANEKN